MGSVAEAVLEFDEAVQVPWRPPLAGSARPAGRPSGLHVVRSPDSRRPHAARAGRLTVAAPVLPAVVRSAYRRPGGSTAVGHSCARCAGAVGAPAAPAVRLTRRARRLLAGLVAALAILLAAGVGSVVAGQDEDLVLVRESSVVVRQGDTLWSIAGAVAGDEDVRAVVAAIRRLNDLQGNTLQPGQVLELP